MKSDLNTKSKEELLAIVREKRESLKNFRFGVSGSRVKNVREARTTKKDIARALTALKQK